MKLKEFGSENRETILLLHGGGLSWWNYQAEAEILQTDYHVVLPILDGHADSDRPFTSIEDNASELIAYLDEALGGTVLLIGGLSLGAQIALEMLAQRRDICRYALIESACVIPSKLTNALIGPAFGSSWGLVKNRRFAKLQFKFLHMNASFFEAYYRDSCKIAKADMIAFLKANTAYSLKASIADTTARVHVLAGGKENRKILTSAEVIKSGIPGCAGHILPRLFHGEFSLNYPERYAAYLKALFLLEERAREAVP
ncbi:MAG: alpha/beta hydrolase [Clostridia bacterium]|nr:alpha/beta hydrolase [Clostridia bacterium]